MSGYYITRYGFIKPVGNKEKPFNTEKFGLENWFANKITACEVRDLIRERRPRWFMKL